MTESENTVEVTILGRKITLRADGNEEYIRQVAQYVDERMEEAQSSSKTSAINIAILAAMNIADDFFKEVGDKKRIYSEVEQQCIDLINYIDSKL